jgi:outer membrane protein TolC
MKLLPEDFNKWYEYVSSKSPVLQYVNGVVAMQKENVKLSKAQNLPKLSAGYMFEKSVGQHFQGVKLGFALPVWSAKNRMSKVKAELMAAEADAELVHLEFYNRIYSSYNSAKTLYKTALDYRKSISAYSKSELLRAALDSGEMNIIDYFTELNFYNTIKEKALEAERNYYQIMAELESVTF